MDQTFVIGVGATLSAVLIFIGSAWLLLSLIIGPRLAYFITASITLAFMLIMGVVWSINPLGPVGRLPEWDLVDLKVTADAIEKFGPASDYPEGDWRAPDEEDQAQLTQASELESSASGIVEERGPKLPGFPDIVSAPVIADDSTRLLEQDGETYGATTVEVPRAEGEKGQPLTAVAVMKYDPGNPLGQARMITVGTLVLFILHLIGLSMTERRIKERQARLAETGAAR